MLGKDFKDEQIRKKKIKDVREGKYNDLVMTVFPSDFQMGDYRTARAQKISAPLEQVQMSLFQIYSDLQRMWEKDVDLEKQAIRRVQENGIIFLDQIDKLASTDITDSHREVSRQGVQRDLLPLIEGTIINTKFGDINTQNILFIACGAFSMAKVEDLIPELLGRLPIRVSLSPITQQQFIRILNEPKYNLLMQQVKLLEQEGITLEYSTQSVAEMAKFAYEMNLNQQNIGARRLHAITEKIVEDVSFDAPNYKGKTFKVDVEYVRAKLQDWYRKVDLRKALI